MGHSLTSGMLAVTLSGTLTPVIFVQINTGGGNIYVWSGYGNISWNGHTWTGIGDLGGVSGVTELNKVQAQGVNFTLNGVDLALVSLALQSLQRYLPAYLWIGALDSNFNVVADPYLTFNGRVDTAQIVSAGPTASISVTAEGRLIAMRNTRWRRYTDQDQRIERPTDGGYTFVDTIQDAIIHWNS
jgi:hypothetical protein